MRWTADGVSRASSIAGAGSPDKASGLRRRELRGPGSDRLPILPDLLKEKGRQSPAGPLSKFRIGYSCGGLIQSTARRVDRSRALSSRWRSRASLNFMNSSSNIAGLGLVTPRPRPPFLLIGGPS
jgi:hypothetical protein